MFKIREFEELRVRTDQSFEIIACDIYEIRSYRDEPHGILIFLDRMLEKAAKDCQIPSSSCKGEEPSMKTGVPCEKHAGVDLHADLHKEQEDGVVINWEESCGVVVLPANVHKRAPFEVDDAAGDMEGVIERVLAEDLLEQHVYKRERRFHELKEVGPSYWGDLPHVDIF